MNTYDRQTFLDNVYYLAKKMNVKIGDLENNVKLSAGYLSKLNNEDNKSNPSIELVCRLAKYFGISVDELLFQKHSDMTKDEEEVLSFINGICNSTKAGKICWQRRSPLYFENLDSDKSGSTALPMVFAKYFPETEEWHNYYNSETYSDFPFVFAGDSFSVSIGTDCTLFLMNVAPIQQRLSGTPHFEFIMVRANKCKTICVSEKGSNTTFRQPLRQLFAVAENSDAHAKPEEPVSIIMKKFLSGEKIEKSDGLDGWDEDADLPF